MGKTVRIPEISIGHAPRSNEGTIKVPLALLRANKTVSPRQINAQLPL